MVNEISPLDVKKMIDEGNSFRFIDVRETWEHELVRIENTELMPLGEFEELSQQLGKDETIIVHCHHGRRSAQACEQLLAQGYSKVMNLEGGIDAWADEVDLDMMKY